MPYANPSWGDISTTTRENRSAEHGSLFTNADPSKVSKPPPIHPVIPKSGGGKPKKSIKK